MMNGFQKFIKLRYIDGKRLVLLLEEEEELQLCSGEYYQL